MNAHTNDQQVSLQPDANFDPTKTAPENTASSTSPEEYTEAAPLTFKTYAKIFSGSFSFLVAGVNDGSVGALIPYIMPQYQINTAIVSTMSDPTLH